jgi:hypothetical protein
MIKVRSGKWYCVKKEHVDQCCHCGMKHLVEIKVDRQGKIWIRVWI